MTMTSLWTTKTFRRLLVAALLLLALLMSVAPTQAAFIDDDPGRIRCGGFSAAGDGPSTEKQCGW